MDYILIDLKLTAEENDFSAIPAKTIYKSRQEIVHEVVSQEGTILKETETNAAVNAFFNKPRPPLYSPAAAIKNGGLSPVATPTALVHASGTRQSRTSGHDCPEGLKKSAY